MSEPLIHIGYHKTGSTWLQEQVFCDERFGFVSTDGPLPIDEAFVALNPFTFSAEQARALFSGLLRSAADKALVPVISHERLSGDVGTGGVDSRMIADRLHETF